MTTRFSAPFIQAINSVGTPLPGAKLYFYAAGTSTPQNTYSDAALTVPNANPVVADSGGKFGDIFLGTSNYKVVLTDSAGTTQYTADPVVGDASSSAVGGGSSQNLLVNGAFSLNLRGVSTAADGDYISDHWYALLQTASIGVTQQTLQEDGQPTNIRLTQSNATPQRMGMGQVVDAAGSQFLRNSPAVLSGRIRCSVSQPISYAILSWTGTADTVTRDVVADWTNGSYVAGAFFLGASLVVTAVGSITPAANVWTALPTLSGTMSGSLNNMIIFVWTEGVIVQNATLDLGVVQVEPGTTPSAFQQLPQPITSANGGPLAGLRNRIINGDMRVDQRKAGTATTTSTSAWTYTVDRWYSYSVGATVSGTRAAGTAPAQYVYRFTGAASVTGIGFGQRIEATNIYDLQSGTVTLGVDLANSLLTSVTWTAYYPTSADSYGTFASPTRTSIATGTFTVTSTITRYSAQITLPANAANGLEIVFTVGAQTSGTWTVGNVQIEGGSTATPFERRPVGMELSLCQRYYFDAASGSATVAHQLSATSTAAVATTLPMMNWPPMRTAPTTTVQNLTYANGSGLSLTITSPSTAQTYMTFSVAGTGFVTFNVLLSAEL
jgi:hypothetical protein